MNFRFLKHTWRIRPTHVHLPFGLRRYGVLALVCLVASVLTLASWHQARKNVYQRESARFQALSQQINNAITDRIQIPLNMLEQTRALVSLNQDLTPQQLSHYVSSLRLKEHYPGIQSVGIIHIITAEQFSSHLAQVQTQPGLEDYKIWPLGTSFPQFPIVMIEPLDTRHRPLIGHDMASTAAQAAVLQTSIENGESRLTILAEPALESIGEHQPGLIFYAPVFKEGLPILTIEQRRAALSGFVFGTFRANDLFSNIFEHSQPNLLASELDIEIFTPADGLNPEEIIYDHDNIQRVTAKSDNTAHQFRTVSTLKIAGQPLKVAVAAVSSFGFLDNPLFPTLILALGIGILLILVPFIYTRSNQAAFLRKSERQLRLVINALPHLICYVDPQEKIRFANLTFESWMERVFTSNTVIEPGSLRRTDFSAEVPSPLPMSLRELFSNESHVLLRPALEEAWRGQTTRGEFNLAFPDGKTRSCEILMVPDRGADGAINGVVLLAVDVSERKRSDSQTRLLVEATTVLHSSLDPQKIRQSFHDLLVPKMADWIEIDLLATQPLEASPQPTNEPLETSSGTLSIPLRVASRTFGHLRLGRHQSRQAFDASDLSFASELARRSALAFENIRLFSDAQFANRAKDEFLATVSHELRTPMNVILGWLEILRTESLDTATIKQAISTMERNAKVQISLINDLLDISRITNGKILLRTRPLNLFELIDGAVESIRPAARAKSIALKFKHSDSLPSPEGDADRLQQVLWNLLTNAVKFTPPGGSIEVRTEHDKTGVRICVQDSGQGIETDFMPFVFERFRQEEGGTTRQHGGLGLGLAIVRYLVELHGGSVTAASQGKGKGATFTVHLPTPPSLGTNTEQVSQPAKAPAIRRPRSLRDLDVLLVDDSPDVRTLLTRVLGKVGANVHAVGTVHECLQILKRSQPDVLISDIGLPDEDGYSLIRKVREFEVAKKRERLPAIALTAYAHPSDAELAFSAGFDLHLAKPVSATDLLQAVEEVLPQDPHQQSNHIPMLHS